MLAHLKRMIGVCLFWLPRDWQIVCLPNKNPVRTADDRKKTWFHLLRCISETKAPSAVNVYTKDGLHQRQEQGFQTKGSFAEEWFEKRRPLAPTSDPFQEIGDQLIFLFVCVGNRFIFFNAMGLLPPQTMEDLYSSTSVCQASPSKDWNRNFF